MDLKKLNQKKLEGIENGHSCYSQYDYRSDVCRYECDERYDCHETTRIERESKKNDQESKPKRRNRNLTPEDKKIYELEIEIQELQNRLGQKSKQLHNLNLDLNKKFLHGKNFYVTMNWASEILIYLKILQIAKTEARKVNKGQRAQYPYIFTTNQPRLAKQLKISRKKAARFLKWFVESGAAKIIKTSPGNQTKTYELGERKKKWASWDGKGRMHYYDVLLFNLGTKRRRTKTQRFYEKEKINLDNKEAEESEN